MVCLLQSNEKGFYQLSQGSYNQKSHRSSFLLQRLEVHIVLLLFWADPIGKHYIIRLFKIQELHCILKCTKYQPRIFMICAFVSSRSPELSMILLAIDLNSSSFCCFSIICLIFSSEYPLEAFKRSYLTSSLV